MYYSLSRRVATSDVDETARQTLVSTVTLMQDCSLFSLESQPVFKDYLDTNHVAMMVASRQMDVLRRPAYGEIVRAETSIYQFRGFLGYRNTIVYDEANEPVATCYAVGAFVSLTDGKLIKLPTEVVDSVEFAPKYDMEYLPRKIVLPKIEPIALDPVAVQRNDIDLYGHMNNAQYVRVAFECLPEGAPTDRMRVSYTNQARVGDLLYPHLYQTDSAVIVSLADADAKPYSIVEFS